MEDLYKDLTNDAEYYDFSNYPQNHPLFSSVHKKEPGLMKDESGGAVPESFVSLRSKMYSLQYSSEHSGKDVRKAKGIGRAAVREMQHSDYLNCLFETKQMSHSFHSIRSHRHELYTLKQTKLSLSPYEDKRFLLNCSIHSLPYGHRRLLKRKCNADYGKCHECASKKKR